MGRMGESFLAAVALIWDRLTTSRYTRYLEQEVERLRARDVAVVDSLLTQVGAPTIGPRISKPMPPIKGKMLPSQFRAMFEKADAKLAADKEKANGS